jgi:hypothetical protein
VIPANHSRRYRVVYSKTAGERTEPVIAWNDAGVPMTLDHTNGSLRDPTGDTDFDRVELAPSPYLAALPGDGWTVQSTKYGSTRSEPVIAWLINPSGGGDMLVGFGLP